MFARVALVVFLKVTARGWGVISQSCSELKHSVMFELCVLSIWTNLSDAVQQSEQFGYLITFIEEIKAKPSDLFLLGIVSSD